MTYCSNSSGTNDHQNVSTRKQPTSPHIGTNDQSNKKSTNKMIMSCPSCGIAIESKYKSGINDLPGLPAGVKFDPSDQEIIEHLEAKVRSDSHDKLHPLIDEFIQTIEGENGICYTHPDKLPGVSKDGIVRHFFHRPSKAYTTGTRKRRKVHTEIEGCETRWHKTGKTRPIFIKSKVKGYKKILVLYTNYGRQRKPEKTNWVMHQYHIGINEDEREGEFVVSKVFYQTQPRQCGGSAAAVKDSPVIKENGLSGPSYSSNNNVIAYYNSTLISFGQGDRTSSHTLIPNINIQSDNSSFLP